MPSPFPGMDPYLEDPTRWPGVHSGLIASARAALNRVLPEGFAADTGERLYVETADRSIYPDVVVGRNQGARQGRRSVGVATAPWVISAPPDEVRESFVEIVAVPGRRVVTVLEVLSPANKSPNSEGARLYRQKQRELIGSEINLVELDLLRAGEHTVAAPLTMLQRKGHWNYLACLHRPVRRWEFEVWPATLAEPLPTIHVPIGKGEEAVELNLQAVLDRTYDEGAYPRLIDYSRAAPGPLTAGERDWIAKILASRNKPSNGTENDPV
jgi:hypothetical protein